MRRFEVEDRAPKPPEFDAFIEELGLIADCEGAWALVGMFWHAPPECCKYLAAHQHVWEGLLARARFADARRYSEGVHVGRRVGL
jgi:hypothetical protein